MEELQVIKEMQDVFQFLHSEDKLQSLYPDSLTKIEIKLASLLGSLGELVAESNKSVNDLEAERKFLFAKSYTDFKKISLERETKLTTNDLENLAEMNIKQNRLSENQAHYQYERLKYWWETVNVMINSLKMRTKYLIKEEISTPTREAS